MKTAIMIISILSCMFVFAQDNYKQAYYIGNAGDTVKGWIDFSTDYNNSICCNFKNEISDEKTQTFFPEQISAYRFENEDFFYVAHEIDSGKYFLQYLVNGEMNLYFRADKNDNRYFYFEENGKITAITKEKDEYTTTHIKHNMAYKKSLAPLFNIYPTIVEKVNSNKFDQKTMMDIVEEYHNLTCTTDKSCIVYATRNPDKSFLNLKFSAALLGYAFNPALMPENVLVWGPGGAAGLAFYYPRISQRTSTILELSVFYSVFMRKDKTNSTLKNIPLALMVRAGQRYVFFDKKFAPFGEIGVHSDMGIYLAGGLKVRTADGNNIFIQAGLDSFHFSIMGAFAKLIYQL